VRWDKVAGSERLNRGSNEGRRLEPGQGCGRPAQRSTTEKNNAREQTEPLSNNQQNKTAIPRIKQR